VDPANILQEIAGQIAGCKNCQLSYSRKKTVPGEGPANAQIMLIGEGPGFYENEQGRPFVGAAGKFLDELLEKAGVSRKEVFITNVVKCRPPGNRDPMPEELAACWVYLERQIETINPLIIVTLGRYSMARFLPNTRISEVHGQPAWVRGRLIIPMFHPAAALHQASLKPSLERDFARLPEWILQAQHNPPNPARGAAAAAAGADHTSESSAPRTAVTRPALPTFEQQSFLIPDPPEPEQPPAAEEEKPDSNEHPTQLSLF
jgi:DNA polymerase